MAFSASLRKQGGRLDRAAVDCVAAFRSRRIRWLRLIADGGHGIDSRSASDAWRFALPVADGSDRGESSRQAEMRQDKQTEEAGSSSEGEHSCC